jgi:hypothetical protein
MGYSIAQAVERVGLDWLEHVPEVERRVRNHSEAVSQVLYEASLQEAQSALFSGGPLQHLATTLVTIGSAPGYRNPSLVFDLRPIGSDRSFRAYLTLRNEDCESIVRHIVDVHAFAWECCPERGPIDRRPGEERPTWTYRPDWERG